MVVRIWRFWNPCTLLVGKTMQPLWKAIWRSLKKLNTELPYKLAIPLLSTDSKDENRYSSKYKYLFKAALVPTAERWRQFNVHQLTANKTWHVPTVEHYSLVKRNEARHVL